MRSERIRTSVVGLDENKLRESLGSSLGNVISDFLKQPEVSLDSIQALALALEGAKKAGAPNWIIYTALLLAQMHISQISEETALMAQQAATRTMTFGSSS